MKYAIFEYIGDYSIDHQPNWSKRFDSLVEAVEEAIQLYLRRLSNDWESDIEARPLTALSYSDNYHIVIQKSNENDENAFDDPAVWGIGCIPELNPEGR